MGAFSEISLHPLKHGRRRLIMRLLRSTQPGAIELAANLARHGLYSSVRSGACPVYQADVQRAMANCLKNQFCSSNSLTALSWFPCEPDIKVGMLSDFDLSRFIASRRRALQRAFPGIHACGVVNVSLLVDTRGHTSWIPEVRLIMDITNTRDFRDYFRMHCRTNGRVVRPLRARTLTAENSAEHFVKATYSVPELKMRGIDHAGLLDTAIRPLTGEAAVEAALFCHRFPPCNRLILRCFRRRGGRNWFGLRRLN